MYLPCEHCFGFLRKPDLLGFLQSSGITLTKYCTGTHYWKSLTLLTAGNDSAKELLSILNKIKTDKESLTVRQDELIKKYGQWLCENTIQKST